MFKKNLLIISVLALLLLPTIAYAIDVPGLPIVFCGLSSQDNPATPQIEGACTRCDLFRLLKNIIDFTVGGLMPPVAILLFVWAGFLILLGGANTNLVAQGRQIFTTTFYGIIIMLSAWMITNTLILSVGAKYNNAQNWWQFTCVETVPVQKYSCSQNGQCVFNPAGQYTNSNCDSQCQTPQEGALSIDTASLSDGTVGQPYSQTVQASGGTTPYGWTMVGSPPAGITFNAATGTISGTPTTAGTSTFTIKVTDASSPPGLSEKQFSITVGDVLPTLKYGCNAQNQCVQDPNGQYTTPNCNGFCQSPPVGILSVVTANLSNATVGQLYVGQLEVQGGTQPYRFAVSAGSLPGGLSLNSAGGDIRGTPTTAGTSTFTARVTDNSTPQQSATKQLSIVVGGTGTSTLSITTSSLPGGTVSQPYSQTIAATGGTGTYSWSVSSGTLPNGLNINFANGRISGTPTTAGTSTFTVRVEDNQQSATKQLSIVVGTSETLACVFNGVDYSTFNLCSGQRRPGGCGTSTCSQYLPSIQRYAGGAATVDVLKTFMVVESDCNIRAGTGTSYGLMQISPNTAKPIAYKCDVNANDITPSWLTDPANADKSICLGAEIIRSIAAGTCGSEPRNIYAGYNAGPGYCTASNDCVGEQSCGGGAKKKWECPYDNPQHTVCNTRMYQTKQGAAYINYCLNNLGF